MAEVLGVSSALVTLVSLAMGSSLTLYQTIVSLQNKEREVRELRDELRDLLTVLQTLQDSLKSLTVDLTTLERPLASVHDICKSFNILIVKCTAHSTEQRTSIRDWLMIRFMGKDITGFKAMLATYKSTINIALADVNIRSTKVTHNVLDKYLELIQDTKFDLEVQLLEIKSQLSSIAGRQADVEVYDTSERQKIEDEKISTEQCLKICADVSAQIELARSTALGTTTPQPDIFNPLTALDSSNLPWLVTAKALNSAQKDFMDSRFQLLQHLLSIDNRLATSSYPSTRSGDDQVDEEKKYQGAAASVAESLAICDQAAERASEARKNIIEDVSIGDHSEQVIVSTLGALIEARRITGGKSSKMVIGQLSDESLQTYWARDNKKTHNKDD